MKIWTVTTHLVCKGDDTGIETEVYTDHDLALKFLEEYKKEDKEIAIDKWGWIIETDTDEDYESFLDGDWPMNHSCCYIREFEV